MSPVERKYIPKEVSQFAVANMRTIQRRRGGVKKMEAGVLSGAAREGTGPNRLVDRMWVFSHLMNQVIHWSTCASAQFSCPCF